jgi:DNA helicase-2/ATP-dependent DNA helicase PcrA
LAAPNGESEARFVVKQIRRLIRDGQPPSSIAVLYRTNFQSRLFEEELLKHSLPYQILGVRFYERKEIKDILSYIKAVQNPEDLLSLKRIINLPSRGIGKTTFLKFLAENSRRFGRDPDFAPGLSSREKEKIANFQNLLKLVKKITIENSASKAIRLIMEKTGYQNFLKDGTEEGEMRLDNLKELVSLARKFDLLKPPLGIEALLCNVALSSEQDSLDNKKQGVRLMTVHAAKGLEFNNVFLVGLEEGLFPINNPVYEEERRLFYVGLTRAKSNIYLSFANFRTIFGEIKVNAPSRFLLEIPEELLKLCDI